jgi:hypothetical protein
MNDSISENEACEIAGVSSTTLSRFVEAGYLRVTTHQDLKFYSKKELSSVFGLPMSTGANNYSEQQHINNTPTAANEFAINESAQIEAETHIEPEQEQQLDAAADIPIDNNTDDAPENTTQNLSGNVERIIIQGEQSSQVGPSEVARLSNILKVYEKIVELREQENTELKKERDWLRNRIERFEEKSDRDQLLLLSETQTIRKLVSISQEQRPSTFRAALEWFGLVPNKKSTDLNPTPINIDKSKY